MTVDCVCMNMAMFIIHGADGRFAYQQRFVAAMIAFSLQRFKACSKWRSVGSPDAPRSRIIQHHSTCTLISPLLLRFLALTQRSQDK